MWMKAGNEFVMKTQEIRVVGVVYGVGWPAFVGRWRHLGQRPKCRQCPTKKLMKAHHENLKDAEENNTLELLSRSEIGAWCKCF